MKNEKRDNVPSTAIASFGESTAELIKKPFAENTLRNRRADLYRLPRGGRRKNTHALNNRKYHLENQSNVFSVYLEFVKNGGVLCVP